MSTDMGDQIYADLGHNAFSTALQICGSRNKVNQDEEESIKEEFRKYYRLNWNHIPTRKAMSRVSNLMILDDHEIRDDWGSKKSDCNPKTTEYYIGTLAREVYWEYQRSLRGDIYNRIEISKKHEAYYNIVADTGILFLDLRASRSFLQKTENKLKFMTDSQWNDINDWVLGDGPISSEEVKSLIVVCSVPLIFLSKKSTDKLPKLNSELDDFKDHFVFGDNFHEQMKILELTKTWKEKYPNRKILFLGGDVHIGGSTSIYHQGKFFCEQLTSSAVCNDVIPLFERAILKFLIGSGGQLTNEWSFKHGSWNRERNYGSVQITTNENSGVINTYLSTYDESFIK